MHTRTGEAEAIGRAKKHTLARNTLCQTGTPHTAADCRSIFAAFATHRRTLSVSPSLFPFSRWTRSLSLSLSAVHAVCISVPVVTLAVAAAAVVALCKSSVSGGTFTDGPEIIIHDWTRAHAMALKLLVLLPLVLLLAEISIFVTEGIASALILLLSLENHTHKFVGAADAADAAAAAAARIAVPTAIEERV